MFRFYFAMSTEPFVPSVMRPVSAVRRRGQALVLEAPRRATAMVLGRLAPVFLPEDRRLYIVDGANGFDPYVFAREARRRGLREDVLDRVFVTRCFTIHQLAAVTREMVPPLLNLKGGAPPAIGVLGLDHLFLEESLRAAERARVLGGVLADLEAPRRHGASLLVTHESVPRDQAWWRPMLEFGDVRVRTRAQGDDWDFQIERCNDGADASYLQYLASGGDRFVEGVPAGPEGGAASGV
ncbi:hypothetical protein GC173_07900 [bacterium]|nr:hypothetical protein [bacterium]